MGVKSKQKFVPLHIYKKLSLAASRVSAKLKVAIAILESGKTVTPEQLKALKE